MNIAGSIYTNKDDEIEVTGKPTEAAVLSFGLTLDVDFDALRSAIDIVRVEPFSSKRKRMGILIRKVYGMPLVIIIIIGPSSRTNKSRDDPSAFDYHVLTIRIRQIHLTYVCTGKVHQRSCYRNVRTFLMKPEWKRRSRPNSAMN